MGDKIIQKNILKVVSERLNPNNNVSEMKQKNCLVCKKKKTLNSPVKKRHTEQPIQKSQTVELKIESEVYSFALNFNLNIKSQSSIHSIELKELLSTSKQQQYFDEIRKVAEEQGKQMIKKWCDYFINFMKNGERFTFQNNLPLYYQKDMTIYREQSEEEIRKFLNSRRQDIVKENEKGNFYKYDQNFMKQLQSAETMPTLKKFQENIVDQQYLRMLLIQAQAVEQLLFQKQQYNEVM